MRRYLIHWKCGDNFGREHWVMERKGVLSSADIKKMEYDLKEKWSLPRPAVISNIVLLN